MPRSDKSIRDCLTACESWLCTTGQDKVAAKAEINMALAKRLGELRSASVRGRFDSFSMLELRQAKKLLNSRDLDPSPTPCDAPVPSKGVVVQGSRKGNPKK